MLKKCLISFCIISALNAHAENTKDLTPKKILEDIQKSDAKKVVNALYSNDEHWQFIGSKIASGNKEWLKVAVELLKGSDAGSTSMLKSSVGEALTAQPSLVLKLFSIDVACDGPDLDSPKFSTKKTALAELDKRIKIVKKIKDQKSNKELCLKQLDQSRSGIENFFKN